MAKNNVKQYITLALFNLLEEKDLSDITIKDIVDRAGVCKSSYYRNYFVVTDIIDQFLYDIFAQAVSSEPMTAFNIRSSILRFFHTVSQYKRELTILSKRNLLDRLNHVIYERALQEINQLDVMHNKYQPHFFSGASAAMICAWIENNYEESEETMADIFVESLHGYMDI